MYIAACPQNTFFQNQIMHICYKGEIDNLLSASYIKHFSSTTALGTYFFEEVIAVGDKDEYFFEQA